MIRIKKTSSQNLRLCEVIPAKGINTGIIPILFLVLFIFSCTSTYQAKTSRKIHRSEILNNQFTGLCVYDLEKEKYIIQHKADLSFTPASNTKLLTMYASLKSFNDSLPALLYQSTLSDGLIIQPVGDPTFLYSSFELQPTFHWLQDLDTIKIYWPAVIPIFGSGWAWDDYPYEFQTERSWWPIYGNRVTVSKTDNDTTVTPPYFGKSVFYPADSSKNSGRALNENQFSVIFDDDSTKTEKRIPFIYSERLFEKLLIDTLHLPITNTFRALDQPDTLFSYPLDTVLAYMLKPSDNFIAEQLLILAAWKNGFSDIESFIANFKEEHLSNLDPIVWKDGSGLSRYNLISPRDQIVLLKQCTEEFGWDRIAKLLPSGGEGTLESWYKSEEPYLFAKTGTLSNNHNLTGYLITKSGKKLIFSFMNNHYLVRNDEVKRAMEEILLSLRDQY